MEKPIHLNVSHYDDPNVLLQFGYKQELKRSFGLVSMTGFCFSILSCWTALGGSLVEAMNVGGPVSLVYGWLVVCAFSMTVAVSIAELGSAYPVAGGQYSWVMLLSKGTWWGKGLSYATGFVQLAGLICMGSSALYQCGLFVSGLATLNGNAENWRPKSWHLVFFCWGLCLACLTVNIFINRILNHISNVALYWSLIGFAICTITILVVTKQKRDALFVFDTFINNSGWDDGGMAVFFLLNAAYGMCCYDAPCHLGEEIDNSSRDVARAVVIGVVIGFITGLIFLLALLFCIQDLDGVANTITGVPLLEIFYQSTNNEAGASCLLTIVLVCAVFESNGLLTEGSRSIFAFARDGAFPYKINKHLSSVHSKYDVPVWSLIVCAIIQCLFIAIYFGSDTAFLTVISIATVGMYASYLVPIVIVIFRRKHKVSGYYNLGKWALFFNIPASVFLTYTSVCFFFPTKLPVTGNNMNYSIAVFVLCGIIGLFCWFLGGRSTYGVSTESTSCENDIIHNRKESIPVL